MNHIEQTVFCLFECSEVIRLLGYGSVQTLFRSKDLELRKGRQWAEMQRP